MISDRIQCTYYDIRLYLMQLLCYQTVSNAPVCYHIIDMYSLFLGLSDCQAVLRDAVLHDSFVSSPTSVRDRQDYAHCFAPIFVAQMGGQWVLQLHKLLG